MAFTTGEETRIRNIEEAIVSLSTAVNNLASKTQLSQLLLIKQAEIDALKRDVESLESQVALLQTQIG